MPPSAVLGGCADEGDPHPPCKEQIEVIPIVALLSVIFTFVILLILIAPGVWSKKPARRKAVRDLLGSVAELVRAVGGVFKHL